MIAWSTFAIAGVLATTSWSTVTTADGYLVAQNAVQVIYSTWTDDCISNAEPLRLSAPVDVVELHLIGERQAYAMQAKQADARPRARYFGRILFPV